MRIRARTRLLKAKWTKMAGPLGAKGIEEIRDIARKDRGGVVNETGVDSFSAGALLVVYDAMHDAAKTEFHKLPVAKAFSLALTIIDEEWPA